MHRARDIYSLTDFKQNAKQHLKRLRARGGAHVLTVNGKAEAVVMTPESYDVLRGEAYEDVKAKIALGLAQARAGLIIDGDEAFRERKALRADFERARKRR